MAGRSKPTELTLVIRPPTALEESCTRHESLIAPSDACVGAFADFVPRPRARGKDRRELLAANLRWRPSVGRAHSAQLVSISDR
ncbi:hypothetical protein EHH60_34305 [Bradyrhizobium sp. RP6]|nr:hypothetical protein EHH60_34305 [Bradyrhizobium sp. RP6]